jgi:hypothetical protein
MATSNIDEIEKLQQNETLKNLLLRIDGAAIDQNQQNEKNLTNLLLRIDEIDKNLTPTLNRKKATQKAAFSKGAFSLPHTKKKAIF